MPQRPVQHEIDAAARRAFAAALPTAWVYREQDEDYGIDAEVELFTEGRATARLFKAQIKGTTTERRTRSVSLPVEKEAYLLGLGLPVLIVLYHASTQMLYHKWFQAFDPHYGGRTEKRLTIRFDSDDEWTPSTPERLAADVETYYRLRDASQTLPLSLSVETIDDSVGGAPARPVSVAIQSQMSRFPHIFATSPTPSGIRGQIRLEANKTVVDFRGLATSTIHYELGSLDHEDVPAIASDVLVSVGLLLARRGLLDPSVPLLTKAAPGSRIALEPDVILQIVGILLRAHRVREALELAEEIGEDIDAAIASLLILPSLLLHDSLNDAERNDVVAMLERKTKRIDERGDQRQAAIAHYNLANRLHSYGRHHDAIRHMNAAVERDPAYLERPYFHKELAGSLFQTEDFEQAASAYGRAIELGSEDVTGQWADALLWSGRYAEAEEAFVSVNASEHSAPEWRLKERALPSIRKAAGTQQTRDPDGAVALADLEPLQAAGQVISNATARERLEGALRLDALCALAWFNLGILESSEGDLRLGFEYFTTAAVLAPGDLDLWKRVALLGLAFADEDLHTDILTCGLFFHRDDFIRAVAEISATIDHEDLRDSLEARLEAALALLPSRRPVELRFLNDEGSYELITLDSDDSDEAPG